MPVDPVKNFVLLVKLVDELKADALMIRCLKGLLTAVDVAHPEYNLRGKVAEALCEPQVNALVDAQFRPLSEAAHLAAEQTLTELLEKLPKQEFKN